MATQEEAVSPNTISSIILALRRMAPSDPERFLPHLNYPEPPDDHDSKFLDAFATLCSLLSQCESASAAIHRAIPESIHPSRLYIATCPSAPPTLRGQIDALYRALHKVTQSSPEHNGSSNYSTACNGFILQVYRSCGGKLLNAIKCNDGAKELLKDVSNMFESELSTRGIAEKDCVELANKGKDMSFSDNELLNLHRVAQMVGEFKGKFNMDSPFILDMRSVSKLVDTLISWATFRGKNSKSATSESDNSKRVIDSNVVFVDPLRVPDFLATTKECEMAKLVKGIPYCDISRKWDIFKPSRAVSEVKGSPGHFTGHGTVHCEISLLHYIHSAENLPIHRYIGGSRPICYLCFMLVDAYNRDVDTEQRFSVGRRSANLKELDIAWSYPPYLRSSILQDLKDCVIDTLHLY